MSTARESLSATSGAELEPGSAAGGGEQAAAKNEIVL
jgi:hypothetical protein